MSETFDEQLSRFDLMCAGDSTWDLSENDIAALCSIRSRIEELEAENERLKAQLARHEAPVSDEDVDNDDNYVAWIKFTNGTLKIADSTDSGAYKVWRKSGIRKLIANRARPQKEDGNG